MVRKPYVPLNQKPECDNTKQCDPRDRNVRAMVSAEHGNSIQQRPDGLFAPAIVYRENTVVEAEDETISVTESQTDDGFRKFDVGVRISLANGNILEVNEDGLFASVDIGEADPVLLLTQGSLIYTPLVPGEGTITYEGDRNVIRILNGLTNIILPVAEEFTRMEELYLVQDGQQNMPLHLNWPVGVTVDNVPGPGSLTFDPRSSIHLLRHRSQEWLVLAGGGVYEANAAAERAEDAAERAEDAAAERFPSRAAFVAWIGAGNVPVPGRNYGADGLFYVGEAGTTNIVDMPGVVPAGIPQPGHYGIFGAGSYTAVKNKALRDFAVAKRSGMHFAQSGAVINRISDRAFLGAAIESDGAWPNVEQDWLTQYQRSHALKLVVGVAASGVTTLGSPIVTFAAGGITPSVGAFFMAARGVPQGATVVSVNSPTEITISVNATATTTGNTFWSQNGQTAGGLGNSAVLFALTEKTPGSSTPAAFGAQSAYSNAAGTSCIGVAGFAINNHPTLRTQAWGGYFEAHRTNANVAGAIGIEIDVASWTPAEINPNPFQQSATTGLFIGAGCGLDYAGQTNVGTAIQIVANPTKFRKGLVFAADSIEGADGMTGAGVALAMANGHQISWYNADGAVTGRVFAVPGLTAAQLSEMRFTSAGVQFQGATGQNMLMLSPVANSVNYPIISGGIAGGPVTINANGSDAAVDLRLTMRGGGYLRYGTFVASADVPITGYITIKDDLGNLRKLAVVA